LFSQMLRLIPRDKFERLVSKHSSDKHQKGINSWTHLVAMLFCHIGGAASVRDISNGLTSTTGNLSHLGVDRVPSKSSPYRILIEIAHRNYSKRYISCYWS